MKRILFLTLLGFFFFSCKVQQVPTGDTPLVIKFIQINDVYEIEPINNGKNGGLSRVAYITDSIKKQFPHTYFFLAGDFVNPSLLGTLKVEGERLQGKQMVEVLNAAGLDLVTFGNHEFDIKEADLQKRMNESQFDWTSANVRQVTSTGKQPFRIQNEERDEAVSDYKIYTVRSPQGKEVKFGVFGVTIPSNPKPFVHYGDIYEEAERAYQAAQKESDFVVGLTHVSLDQDKEIAKRIPTLRLIMGGHEHYNMKENVGKTVITKADANVVSVYVHTLTYSQQNKELQINSELLPVTDAYPFDREVQAVVDKWTSLLDENLSTIVENPNDIIYVTDEMLDGTDEGSRSRQTNLGQIINKSMSAAFDPEPDAVITNGGGIRIDDWLTGELTSKDVFRILPYGGKVLRVDMTGDLLKQVLNYGSNASGTGAYLQRHLISKDKEEWLIRDNPLDEEQIYTVALNDFLMEGLDIPFLTPDNPGVKAIQIPAEEETASDLRKCIIQYLKNLD